MPASSTTAVRDDLYHRTKQLSACSRVQCSQPIPTERLGTLPMARGERVPEHEVALPYRIGMHRCSTKSRLTRGGLFSSLRDLYPRFLFVRRRAC
jgi:hypothetical protein